MKGKILTILIILALAAFIYYNKGSLFDKYKTRRSLENRIEEITGLDINLKDFFKGIEGIDKKLDLKERFENLTEEETQALSDLLEEKGEEAESFLEDMIENVSSGDKN